jgi:phosphatidylcholine synthase
MERDMQQGSPSLGARVAAYAVHLYTATGALFAFLVVLTAINHMLQWALGLEFLAMVVDGTDGWLARRVKASSVVPFDGRKLDDIVDYLTYVFAPVVLLWVGGYLPPGGLGVALAALPLLSSCYQFCQANAKTPDHFFLGFPSYWNIVAFYVVVFALRPEAVAVLLVICTLLVFVPVLYVYPSRTATLYPITLGLTGVWLVAYLVIVLQLPHPAGWLVAASLLYAVYYVALSAVLTVRKLGRVTRSTGKASP